MEEINVKRVHEKSLNTNLVNSYGMSAFMVSRVFLQVNKPVQYWLSSKYREVCRERYALTHLPRSKLSQAVRGGLVKGSAY